MGNPDRAEDTRVPARAFVPAILLAGAMLGAVGAPAFGQEAAAPPPGVAACVSIEIDAARLACYDAAAGRSVPSTREADAAAEAAQAAAEAAEAAARAARAAQASALPHPTPSERAAAAMRRGGASLFRRDAPGAAAAPAALDPAAQAAIANAGKGSLLDTRWELARDSKLGIFNFRAYKPVYLFPAFWSSAPNTHPFSPTRGLATATEAGAVDALEAKFQISFKTKAVENLFGDNGDLWMAYTQSSRWQVYNADASRPFRETDYEPEVMLAFRTGYGLLGWKGRLFAVGVDHQSNGRSDPLSRSWNRVMFDFGFDREGWALNLRPWIRVPEHGHGDDNPDISDYMGRGDATLVRTFGDGQQLSLMLRHSLRGGDRSHGAVQFDWAFPLHDTFRGHLQVFDGYGESMIDYNHRATYVGLGISLMEWY
jgi:phospholipase A1